MNLNINKLVKTYSGRTVVEEVTLTLNEGEIVGLLGPNGAGKTTTFYMIVGLIQSDSGSIFLDDIDISKYPMYKRAKLGIGYLAQESSIFRSMTVEDNIFSVLQMTNLSKTDRRRKCNHLLEEFGLTKIKYNIGSKLSGGERRRTEIARSLATDPSFILLDEPFAGVDPIAVEDIQIIISKLKERNIGVLITDHNVHETLSITDRSYLLYEGKILKSGTTDDLVSDDKVRKLYLGDNFELR